MYRRSLLKRSVLRHGPVQISVCYSQPQYHSTILTYARHSQPALSMTTLHRRRYLYRTFHSMLWNWFMTVPVVTQPTTIGGNNHPSDDYIDSDATKQSLRIDAIKEETIEERNYRYSMINAHPLGPWQAILLEVQRHYHDFTLHSNYNNEKHSIHPKENHPVDDTGIHQSDDKLYTILDVGCGPRGQPGTTIAHALPQASVHCIDSCVQTIHSIPTVPVAHPYSFIHSLQIHSMTTVPEGSCVLSLPPSPEAMIQPLFSWQILPLPPMLPISLLRPQIPPPSNLIKSVCNMDHLSTQFIPNSINVIVSCFGYGSSSDRDNIQSSLRQAYETLVPGGILILCTWQYSSLLALSHDMTTTLQHGCGDSATMIRIQHQDHMDDGTVRNNASLSSNSAGGRYPTIQYSDTNEWEDLLHTAGFQIPNHIQSTIHTYPICLGSTPQEQLNFGTLLIPIDVQGYHNNSMKHRYSNDWFNFMRTTERTGTTTTTVSGYRNNTEEAFWMNVSEHINKQNGSTMYDDESRSSRHRKSNDENNSNDDNVDTSIWMPKNIFKLTISTK